MASIGVEHPKVCVQVYVHICKVCGCVCVHTRNLGCVWHPIAIIAPPPPPPHTHTHMHSSDLHHCHPYLHRVTSVMKTIWTPDPPPPPPPHTHTHTLLGFTSLSSLLTQSNDCHEDDLDSRPKEHREKLEPSWGLEHIFCYWLPTKIFLWFLC